MTAPAARLRTLELYCGIGGVAAALGRDGEIAGAIDINTRALAVYHHNFDHPTHAASLETLPAARLAAAQATLWWLSPPCQPFTRRGRGRDADDPRSRSLLRLLEEIQHLRPRYLALENVPGFQGSKTHERLRAVLEQAGYGIAERLLCTTELGVPMRRQRFYLLAAAEHPMPDPWPKPVPVPRLLATFLEPVRNQDPSLAVPASLARAYRGALDIVDARDPDALCACFTAAYGRSPVRSGSYLRLPGGGLRRFHPREILALLGFPAAFRLPQDLTPPQAWRLVGNSLSVDAVRHVLGILRMIGASAPPPKDRGPRITDGRDQHS